MEGDGESVMEESEISVFGKRVVWRSKMSRTDCMVNWGWASGCVMEDEVGLCVDVVVTLLVVVAVVMV